jgi:RNA polymerase sigma-70 factor (ECF subfamily)
MPATTSPSRSAAGIGSPAIDAVTPSDAYLIERVHGGDTNGFVELMRRYNQRLFRVARAIVRNDADAEDVVQHAYVAAFSHLQQFSGLSAFSTWLTRIAINQSIARLRDRTRLRSLAGDGAPADWRFGTHAQGDPEDHVGRSELARLLEDAIEALPTKYRAIVVLRELEGLSTQEAAACLSISDEAARVRLHRARQLLREQLWPQLQAAPSELFSFGGQRCARMVSRVLAALSVQLPVNAAVRY